MGPSFKGGVATPHHKEATEHVEISRAPMPARLVVPMSQHLGAPCEPLVAKGDVNSASKLAKESSATVSRILLQGMEHYQSARRRDDFEAAMDESIMEAIPRLEKRTHYLAMFANIATLLGLLGTIIGLIKAFTAVAQVDPSMKAEILSTSISVAMNTTAFGLIVAIPLLFFYTVLQTKTTEIVDSLEMTVVKFVNHLSRVKNSAQ